MKNSFDWKQIEEISLQNSKSFHTNAPFEFKLGTPPNCECAETFAFDEIHWYCRPWYLSTSTVTPEIITPQCNAFQIGTYPDCQWRPCPSNSLNPNEREPNCKYNYTIGFKPCDNGLVGTYPDCHQPCPAHREFIYAKTNFKLWMNECMMIHLIIRIVRLRPISRLS